MRLYGRFETNASSKLFDNSDFGYTRVTVERPLKLRYQMTLEDKARFLDAALRHWYFTAYKKRGGSRRVVIVG